MARNVARGAVLYLDTDETTAAAVSQRLAPLAERIDVVDTARETFGRIAAGDVALIVVAHRPPEIDAVRFLRDVNVPGRRVPPVIVAVESDQMPALLEALKGGCEGYALRSDAATTAELIYFSAKRTLDRREFAEQKRRLEASFAEQRRMLEGAMANIDQGISVFDADLRLVICNRRYRELFDYPENLVGPGTPLEAILRYKAEIGEYGPCNVEHEVAARIQQARNSRPHSYEHVRPNGRALDVRGGPMPGGGFVATYTDISQRKALEEQLRRLATTDELTGAGNRRHFMGLTVKEFDRARRYGHPLSVLMLDADRFKRVNDTYGHKVGDEVLKALADVCRRLERETDIFGRLGGEEFALTLPSTDIAGAAAFAERLRKAIGEARVPVSTGHLSFTVSIGAAQLNDGDGTVDDLLARADECLYAAKQSGRNRVVAAKPGVNATSAPEVAPKKARSA